MKQIALLLLIVFGLAGCSTSETSSSESSATDSSAVVLTSKEKVSWAIEPYDGSDVDFKNPIGIAFNVNAELIDTASFKKFLGAGATLREVQPSDVTIPRYIVKFKESEIAIVQVWQSGQTPETMIFSAIIRNEEIPLKNGVKVGMTKSDVLSKYDWIKTPSDVIYVVDSDRSLLRFEFHDNVLTYIEFWAESNIVNTYAFGGMNVMEFNRRYIPVSSPKNKNDYLQMMGSGAQVYNEAISVDVENDQGKSKIDAIHYLITNGDSQVELIDFDKTDKSLSVVSAIISDPRIELITSIKVGTSRKDILKLFELPNTGVANQTLVLNTERGKLRIAFKNDVVSLVELKNEHALVLPRKAEEPEIALAKNDLSKFTYTSPSAIEMSLAKDGTFSMSDMEKGTSETGRWNADNYSLKFYRQSDTLSFEIESFTANEIILVTSRDEEGEFIHEVQSTDGWFYGRFYRNIYSAPFNENQIIGSWNAALGSCVFESGNQFRYGEPDCDTNGTWKISGSSLSLKLKDSQCQPFNPNSTIERLSHGMIMLRNSEGQINTLTRLQ